MLKPDGQIYLSPFNQRANGSFETDWPWYRGIDGELTIEGHRLDAKTEPLQYELLEGFNNFQSSTLIFPSTGCWEITGHVGDASLTFVTEVLFDAVIPTPTVITTPNVVTNGTATPIAHSEGYDWRGANLYLNAPLPEAPAEANVYLLKSDQAATVDEARALAERFGIQGEIYLSPNPVTKTNDYLITDGKQSLTVASNLLFTYTTDTARAYNNLGGVTNPNAEAIINDFLQTYGFNVPHKVDSAAPGNGYIVEPLSPDGFPMRYEFFSSYPMHVILDENGQVLQVEANLMDHEAVSTQTYGIISAQEAFQKLLDDSILTGKIESALSSSLSQPTEWRRDYDRNEKITIYGYASSTPALDSTKSSFAQIDGYTITGNTSGFDALAPNTFIEATGQFVTENGIEKFNVESWKPSEFQQDGLVGTLHRENGQVLLSTPDQGDLILNPNVPTDLPMPFENAFVVGVRKGNNYEWTLIDDRMTMGGGGGGGGGGLGFYKLNLSGTPVAFPTPTPQPSFTQGTGEYTVKEGDTLSMIAQNYGITVDELMQANGLSDPLIFIGQKIIIPGAESVPSEVGQKIAGLHGLVSVNIYTQADGSQRVEYGLVADVGSNPAGYMLLEGSDLQALQNYNNRPVKIWGTVERANENGILVIKVDHYEIPFSDLNFQILRGRQKNTQVQGQAATLFTTEDGKTYVQLFVDGTPGSSLIGNEGDPVLIEALAIPDELFGGYPALRVFSGAMAINPKSGEQTELTITADRPQMMDEALAPQNYVPPTLTIEKVELMYYVTNPNWQVDHLDGSPLYIQPVWRFYGHYDDGGEFEVIVQALKEEYLLPELASHIQGG